MTVTAPPCLRLDTLLNFDEQYRTDKKVVIIGADEVGRGSCIGPVVAGAVATPTTLTDDLQADLAHLNDSKQLSAKQRDIIYQALLDAQHGDDPPIASALGEASQHEVDTLNVYQASLLAIHRALHLLLKKHPKLCKQPIVLLLDGKATLPNALLPKPTQPISQHAIIKGDSKSFAIAAASVLAKQYRDRMIIEWASSCAEYGQYGWHTNMGYPTPAHKKALLQYGPSDKHRTQYKIVQQALHAHQQSLFESVS